MLLLVFNSLQHKPYFHFKSSNNSKLPQKLPITNKELKDIIEKTKESAYLEAKSEFDNKLKKLKISQDGIKENGEYLSSIEAYEIIQRLCNAITDDDEIVNYEIQCDCLIADVQNIIRVTIQ